MKPRLSVILITKNEAAMIDAALASVAWADEIIVLDSGSTDDTLARCRAYTQQVFVATDWQGFGVQKNRALAYAQGEWVLSIDADERVSPELAAEIQREIAWPRVGGAGEAGRCEVYTMPRLSSFLGRPIRHGDWWPDPVARLFRRGSARFSDDVVHERLLFEGQAGTLRQLLHHESVRSLEQLCDKLNHYSSAGAERMRARGRAGGLGRALAHGLWAFLRSYLFKRGFLDGREGFIIAVSIAEGSYYRYLKRLYLP